MITGFPFGLFAGGGLLQLLEICRMAKHAPRSKCVSEIEKAQLTHYSSGYSHVAKVVAEIRSVFDTFWRRTWR